MDEIKIGCVLLAAGNSARFGENKLLTEIDGRLMIERALDAIPADKLCDIVVVTQYESVKRLAEERGYSCVVNDRPQLGISRSVNLGTTALTDKCDGAIYMVADQPWLRRESVSGMLDRFSKDPDSIISMSSGGKRGNPCIFPKACFDELCALSGDKGGRAVIEKHKGSLILYEVPERELADIDTPDDISIKEQ